MYAGRTNSIVKTGGTTPTPTQTKEVKATSFPTVVSPDSGYALSQATVTAPDNLTAENIKSGVSIAGVTGTYAGSGGGSGQLDETTAFYMRLIQRGGERHDSSDNLIPLNLRKEYWPDILPQVEFGIGIPHLAMTNHCFAYCKLDTVELPEGKADSYNEGTQIGSYCFFNAGNTNNETSGMVVTGSPSETYVFAGHVFDSAYLSDVPDVNYKDNTINNNNFSLTKFHKCNVPEGITTIKEMAFNMVTVSDNKVVLPSTLTKISGYSTIAGTYGKNINVILKSTTPPTMDNSSGIQYVDSITVPAGTLEAYRTATNWSAFADKMVEATENAGTTEGGA